MDGFNEKKWFVYMTDHHEGPFSLEEIQAKMVHSQVTVSNYVWAEGMGDWKPMTDIPEFESVLSAANSTPSIRMPATGETPDPLSVAPLEFAMESAPPVFEEAKSAGMSVADLSRQGSSLIASPASLETPVLLQGDRHLKSTSTAPRLSAPAPTPTVVNKSQGAGRAIRLALFILIPAGIAGAYFQGYLDPVIQSPMVSAGVRTVSDAIQPQLIKLTEKFPVLGKWISPIPTLEDVAPAEYEELKNAALSKPDAGVRLAIALSTADILAPYFYLSDNLPERAVLDIYVEGVSDTLLNQLSFSTKLQATVEKKLGKTAPIRFTDGKPLPRGEYVIYVSEGAMQPEPVKAVLANIPPVNAKAPAALPRGFKLLISKSYFLGGKKDTIYDSRLKEFHDKLRAKASAELAEIHQLATLLDNQLGTSVTKFTQLHAAVRKNKAAPSTRKAWGDFDKQWNGLNEGLRQSYAKWTPDALQKEYFYGMIYQLVQQAGIAVEQVHQLHQAFFEGKTDPKSFEIQLGTAKSGAQNALSALKAKIDQAEKLVPTPNGMPRREGL